MPDKPTFFATPETFRAWLKKHHEQRQELLVGFYKKDSHTPSISWPESVDQALCFGWIDGVRKGVDDVSYTIRFTPRKPGSTWSAVNVRRVKELRTLKMMDPAGMRAFERRQDDNTGIYGYEQRKAAKLDAAAERTFRAKQKAWQFFQDQAPWYRRTAIWWVVSAKKEETRRRRLETLIDDSARGRTIAPLTRRARTT